MLIGRRFGRPGLIGTVARTAVITGTAAMTAGAISHHQQQKYAAQQQAGALDQDAAQPAPTTASVDPLVERINQLAALHASGVLTDSEFSEAKAKLLAG
jgi:hypothetical protein